MSFDAKKPHRFATPSSIELKECFYSSDLHETGSQETPGKYPFTRGIHKTMYRERRWTMRQYAGFGTAKETNARYKYLLSQGTTGLSVAFDLPTQMGRDSDHALSTGEVGRVGVAISTLEDMEILLDTLPLDKISISMTINATASILLAFLIVAAEKKGIKGDLLRGTIQNDILKEYIARGTYIFPIQPAMRIVTDIFEFCQINLPNFNTISISGYHIREAGSTAVEEIAFTLADAIAYVEAALSKGQEIDDFAPRLAFFMNCHNDFLEEVAKFRAARRMWAKIAQERFGAKKMESMMFRFHTQTAGSSLTAQQPLNNVIRTTIQALAAVFGGTQSLHTNSFDEALGLPTEESAQLALRTQQIISLESGVAQTVDPFGGSYAVEWLTDELERQANEVISVIDSMGGMIKAIDAGYPQSRIEESAYRYQQAIEENRQVIVGINQLKSEDESSSYSGMKHENEGERDQRERLKKFKKVRDGKDVDEALLQLKGAAEGTQNLMPLIVSAVRSHATLGEISDVLRDVFGEYQGG